MWFLNANTQTHIDSIKGNVRRQMRFPPYGFIRDNIALIKMLSSFLSIMLKRLEHFEMSVLSENIPCMDYRLGKKK